MSAKEDEKKESKKPEKTAQKTFSDKVKEFKKALNNEDIGDNPMETSGESIAGQELTDEQTKIKTLETELEESKTLSVEYLDKLRRNMAEFDNFRKRTVKEKSAMYDDAVKDTLEKLIPVLDNFELALNAAMNKDDNFYRGVDMIYKQLGTALTDLGVEEIPALGCTFDPNIHNAVQHVADETFGDNEIIEEMRKGYRYKERIIRHSMVKVAN